MAIRANLSLDQGSDFYMSFNILDDNNLPIDISDYTAVSQMRQHFSSIGYYSFDVETTSSGELILTMGSEVTDTIKPGRYVYDVELTATDGKKSRVVQGIVFVSAQVSK